MGPLRRLRVAHAPEAVKASERCTMPGIACTDCSYIKRLMLLYPPEEL